MNETSFGLQHQSGLPFESDLRGVDPDEFARETRALELVAQGEGARAIELLRESTLPNRLRKLPDAFGEGAKAASDAKSFRMPVGTNRMEAYRTRTAKALRIEGERLDSCPE